MSEPSRIGYLTEDPAKDYAAMLDAAVDADDLRAKLKGWRKLAPDAIAAARKMDARDFAEFKRGLQSERGGVFAGEEWADRFMDILLPSRMLRASMLANDFKVPWGLAWLRLKELDK
jgi:hypothetical protein